MKNIELDNEINMRDLGGISGGNVIVRPKQFIRSANISEITNNDISKLINDYNLKLVIDLRNSHEVGAAPDVLIPGVKYVNIPILNERVEGITRESNKVKMSKIPNMCDLYLQMVRDDSCCDRIKKILKLIMKDKNRCVLFHCSVGKDRTGIIALLILTMLGIDEEEIMKDYLYSNLVCKKDALLNYNFLLEKTHDEEYSRGASEAFLAKEEYLTSAIDYMKEEYGSILNYIIYGLGIKPRHIEKFRKSCTMLGE